VNPYQAFFENPLAFTDPDGTDPVEAYFRGFLAVRGKIRECLGVTGGWEDAFLGALRSGLGNVFESATELNPPPPPRRCICLNRVGHDPVCHFGQRPEGFKGKGLCTCGSLGACEPGCPGATHWMTSTHIYPDNGSSGTTDVGPYSPAGIDPPASSGAPILQWDPVRMVHLLGDRVLNPADDRGEPPLIEFAPEAPDHDIYWVGHYKDIPGIMKMYPFAPDNRRDAWWNPDLTRRSFDLTRTYDLHEVIQ
jgi:hypothetical protein